ncbi:glycosyltransferase family 2 protein [Bradyrhizobium sp. SYSU BS000235]|uniref:glycosyltransferase family 2 protein n=1 Tax=Bradyrhizobium sp. SYSU BS000235 TaxID=3411332 RepID=UPI003C7899FA
MDFPSNSPGAADTGQSSEQISLFARSRVPDLSIIVPCLNEEENIAVILSKLRDVLSGSDISAEVIVVDDQSDDKTFERAKAFAASVKGIMQIEVIRRPLRRRGYGAAVRYGVANSIGKYCIFVSADAVDPINLIPLFFRRMEAGFDLVQCSRYLQQGDDVTIPFKYKFYQFFYRFGVRTFLGENVRDSTYAFKMFKRADALGVGLTQNRFSISPEITFKVMLNQGRIEHVPAGQGIRTAGTSKFFFRKEAFGYSYVLLRALLHRTGLILWF